HIQSPIEGIVEWYSFIDEHGVPRGGKLRLVHECSVSPLLKMGLKRKGCSLDMHEELYGSTGTTGSAPLGEFLGPGGLMRLLSFITGEEFPAGDVIRMIKRLHVPGYEAARIFFRKAALEGIVQPKTSEDQYCFNDIAAVLQWLEERKG
ncbi:MAG TPA: hypothetical protein PLI53_10935, partial [Geobacteraceae bacterium]|nr:hypothetical protein [Geobacteraceae bacterium]